MKIAAGRPLLIYDGDCGFCRRWILFFKMLSGPLVAYAPYQRVKKNFPNISLDSFKQSVQLVDRDDKIYQGAEAVFRSLTYVPGQTGWMWLYRFVPGFKFFSELFYRMVAKYRYFFSKLTRIFYGEDLKPASYVFVRTLFLRGLGLIYLSAFISLLVQVKGLIGSHGILPIAQAFPWASDGVLVMGCWLGILASVLIVAGIFPAIPLTLCWGLYLAYVIAGQVFFTFQWDVLLLEVGFLAIFFPGGKPSMFMIWLFRWLLFRLMFASGLVKLYSGDLVWRNFTALDFHYQTQPLPHMLSWFAHFMPHTIHAASMWLMYGIELVVPFLIFFPRRARFVAAGAIIGLMAMIMLTGNYCFFNFLVILLCLLLMDDRFFGRFSKKIVLPSGTLVRYARILVFVLIMYWSVSLELGRFALQSPPPSIPANIVNGYGLFAVMTTHRNEIIIEGSQDGKNWEAYEFKWKPGDMHRRPSWVQPHQPRLDWQMWFAALSDYRYQPWFMQFLVRLTEGSSDVTELLAKNPFKDHPPRYIRAQLYEYVFSKSPGQWWDRTYIGPYTPTFTVR